MNSPNHKKIKTAAYRLLARREYSTCRIKQKLLSKGYAEEEVVIALEALGHEGVLSDQRFVESYLHYRQSRGYGPQRIRQELLAHGISKGMIEDQLDITDNTWFAEAKRVWQKRFRGKLPSDMKERSKQVHFLQYRGFTQEQIENIFDLDDIEDYAEKTNSIA